MFTYKLECACGL